MPKKPVLESAVMDVLWTSGEWVRPRGVLEALPAERRLAYTTVLTALIRLWKKGVVERRRAGKGHEYRPRLSKIQHAALRMEEILDTAGDRRLALSRFLDALSESERRELKRLLE